MRKPYLLPRPQQALRLHLHKNSGRDRAQSIRPLPTSATSLGALASLTRPATVPILVFRDGQAMAAQQVFARRGTRAALAVHRALCIRSMNAGRATRIVVPINNASRIRRLTVALLRVDGRYRARIAHGRIVTRDRHVIQMALVSFPVPRLVHRLWLAGRKRGVFQARLPRAPVVSPLVAAVSRAPPGSVQAARHPVLAARSPARPPPASR